MNKTAIARRPISGAKKLNLIIGHFVQVMVACGVLMWSVFNIWFNVLEYYSKQEVDQNWTITAGMMILTCVVPLGVGLYLMFKSLGKSPQAPKG